MIYRWKLHIMISSDVYDGSKKNITDQMGNMTDMYPLAKALRSNCAMRYAQRQIRLAVLRSKK